MLLRASVAVLLPSATAIAAIGETLDAGKPFFAYVTPTAPHSSVGVEASMAISGLPSHLSHLPHFRREWGWRCYVPMASCC